MHHRIRPCMNYGLVVSLYRIDPPSNLLEDVFFSFLRIFFFSNNEYTKKKITIYHFIYKLGFSLV